MPRKKFPSLQPSNVNEIYDEEGILQLLFLMVAKPNSFVPLRWESVYKAKLHLNIKLHNIDYG